jgi:hypothetical protein
LTNGKKRQETQETQQRKPEQKAGRDDRVGSAYHSGDPVARGWHLAAGITSENA